MKTGRAGIALIKNFEGCVLQSYRDPVGVWTLGFGHTTAAGPPEVKAGMKITKEEAEEILVRDLGKYETAVTRGLTRVPTQNQFDAMVSLCYNIGPGNFAKSSVLRHFNAGQFGSAASSFALWNKADGRVLAGLSRRRAAEASLFSKAVLPPPPDVEPPGHTDLMVTPESIDPWLKKNPPPQTWWEALVELWKELVGMFGSK